MLLRSCCILVIAALASWLLLDWRAPPLAPAGSQQYPADREDLGPGQSSTSTSGLPRTPVDAGAANLSAEAAADQAENAQQGLVRLDQLPDGLRKATQVGVRRCRKSWLAIEAPWPRGSIWLTLESAERIVRSEKDLKRQIDEAGLAEQKVLVRRMKASPDSGVFYQFAERHNADALLSAKYPGWPEGYVFCTTGNAAEGLRTVAWRVEGDAELQQLRGEIGVIAGDVAAAIRQSYRTMLVFVE